jgi:hypothetical protein
MYGPFPTDRPAGLRRRSIPAGVEWWRLDNTAPNTWTWGGFPTPRYRFDPASGLFRVRYAAQSLHGAARERYLDAGRFIPADHASHRLVRLVSTRALRVLDLRTEANLTALDVDDRVNTSHDPIVWDACHRLTDSVQSWWPADIDGIVYRSRTTPQTSLSLAFFSLGGLQPTSWALSTRTADLDELILNHDFTVAFPY